MIGRRRFTPRVVLLGTAFAGILAAHAIDYWIVAPNGAHRHELLLGSGHGYWPHVAAIGVIAAVVAALASIGSGFSRADGAMPDAWVLALLQAGGFVSLEAMERIGAGSAGRLFVPLLALGIVLQVIVACVSSLVVRALARVGAALQALVARARVRIPARALGVVTVHVARVRTAFTDSRGVRGPPLLSR